jgi:hypothetical protein
MVAIEKFWKKPEVDAASTHPTTEGIIIEGECFHVAPFNERLILDLTTPHGVSSGNFIAFLFWLGRFGCHVVKVEENMEISPVHSQYYQLTIGQKQQLEGQIKSGLAGITTAVSDFELLEHDLRKYSDFMEIFEKIEKGRREKNNDLVMQGEQSLKAIFIDEVDAHTGEGIALRSIAPRWPTIIADFMKLDDEDFDPGKIGKKLQVSEAEGVVLSTKNKLYKQWKNVFVETVKGRYGRIMGLVRARKKSIDEYRNMLKPYIMRYRGINELGATPEGRQKLAAASWINSKGQAVSLEFSTLWAYKPLHPADLFKAPVQAMVDKVSPLSMPFPQEFKERIRKDMDAIKEAKLDKVTMHSSGVEPLDKWSLQFVKYIEEEYKIKFSTVEILKIREEFVDFCDKKSWYSPYYSVIEMKPNRTVIRMPDGTEIENLMIDKISLYLDSLNVMLARFFEVNAQEKEMENYIGEMLGEVAVTEMQGKLVSGIKSIDDIASGQFPGVYGKEIPKEEGKKEKSKADKAKDTMKKFGFGMMLVKPGPYETNFDDRITGPYFTEMAASMWSPVISFLKAEFKVPGAHARGR